MKKSYHSGPYRYRKGDEEIVVNFTCQLVRAAVPRDLVRCYSGCLCEGVLGNNLQENQWPLSKANRPPDWVGLVQSVGCKLV